MTEEQKIIFADLENTYRDRIAQLSKDFNNRCAEAGIPASECEATLTTAHLHFAVHIMLYVSQFSARQCAQFTYDAAEIILTSQDSG